MSLFIAHILGAMVCIGLVGKGADLGSIIYKAGEPSLDFQKLLVYHVGQLSEYGKDLITIIVKSV